MLRLRTTTSLSVLALAIGIVGTGWLSTLTADWRGPLPRVAATRHVPPPTRRSLPASYRRGAASMAQARRANAEQPSRGMAAVTVIGGAHAAAVAPPPALVPLTTPADMSLSWDELRGHLDGRVVLLVTINDSGRVSTASIAESSGDSILDAHALRSVRGWRFAVPADHPDGISGELPMRFSSRGDGIASAP